MPKTRAPLDYERYQNLHSQGLSLRQIAKELGIAESTLRDNLKVMQKAQASYGLPQGDPGPPHDHQGIPKGPPDIGKGPRQGPPEGDQGMRTPQVALGPPQPDQAETAALAGRATPPPHPGGPDDTEGGPLGITHWPPEGDLGLPRGPSQEDQTAFEGLPKGDLGIPMIGVPQGNSGGHIVALSAQDLQDLQGLLAWWRDRHRLVQDAAAPERQMERQTYHIEKRFIEAVRREADLTGESYAAVVNRAFAQYFDQRSP